MVRPCLRDLHTDVRVFFTRIIAEYHGTDIILRKSRKAFESTNKKKKSVMLSDNPCEFASWQAFTRISSFFTRITAEYHGTDIILRKLRNAIKSTNKKKKSVMLSNNPCEFASWQAFTQISEFFHTDNRGVSRNKCNLGKIEKCRWIEKQEKKSVMLSDNPCENSQL